MTKEEVYEEVMSHSYNQEEPVVPVTNFWGAMDVLGTKWDSPSILSLVKASIGACRPFRPSDVRAIVDLITDAANHYENTVFWELRDAEDSNNKRRIMLATLALKDGWVCSYCKESGGRSLGPDHRPWHIDHVYAQSLGGDNNPDNLILSCATCNLQKGAKLLADFLKSKSADNRTCQEKAASSTESIRSELLSEKIM